MKKKITHPDGRVEEFEGTPEELAQLEKAAQKSRQNETKKTQKRILNEEAQKMLEELQKRVQVLERQQPLQQPIFIPYPSPQYIPYLPVPEKRWYPYEIWCGDVQLTVGTPSEQLKGCEHDIGLPTSFTLS